MQNRKHIVVLFITTLFAIFFSGFIEYQNVLYSNSDLHKYIAMAKSFPDINTEVIKPYVYRIGAPWLAGLLPFSIPVNFFLLNSIGLFLLALSFYFFLTEYGITGRVAVITTVVFQFNRYFFQFLAWNYFQLPDTLGLASLFYAMVLIRRKNYLPFAILLFTGILIKEYVLMIIPAGVVLLYELKSEKKEYLVFAATAIFTLFIFVTLRQVIPAEKGEGLLSQYITQIVYYSKPLLLVKKFLIPFTPFVLLPVIFYKELIDLFKNNKHLLVYVLTVILLSFFGEPERLITPLAPVFFLFLSKIISSCFFYNHTDKIREKKELIVIIGMTVIGSLYHLWGLILLPDKLYSLVFTIVTTLIVTVVFLLLKRKNS